MKIGLVCPYDFFRHGAVQKLVEILDADLTERGHDVRIITPRPRKYKGDVPPRMLFVGQSTKWNTPIKTTLEVGLTLETEELEEMLEAEQFDLIHVHEPEVPILGAQISARAACPIVATFHATFPETAMGKTIELFRVPFARSIFKNIAAMTAVSDTAARFVREWSKLDVEIVPNYVDVEYFSPSADKKRDDNMILYVGRLEKRKGVRYLIEAFKELAEKDDKAHLVIAGEGVERTRLERLVLDYEIPRVKFLGAVDEKKKLELLHEASLFCSPALFGESFGIVLLEAMAAGLPIVAGDNPGYQCVMKDTGLLSLVNPKDPIEFARRLELLLREQEVRDTFLHWSNQYVQQFDVKTVIDQYVKVYDKAVRVKSRASA